MTLDTSDDPSGLADVKQLVLAAAIASLGYVFRVVGAMLSSPKSSEFIGNFAPSDKKAMCLGFSQIPIAVGRTLQARLGPMLYAWFASKDRFSRELLADRIGANTITMPTDDVMATLAEKAEMAPEALANLLDTDAQAFVGAVPQR